MTYNYHPKLICNVLLVSLVVCLAKLNFNKTQFRHIHRESVKSKVIIHNSVQHLYKILGIHKPDGFLVIVINIIIVKCILPPSYAAR